MYERNMKFFLVMIVIGFFCTIVFHKTFMASAGITMVGMSILAMLRCRNTYEDSLGRPRKITEMVADKPHKVEAIGEISGNRLIWLRKLVVSYEHSKIVLDQEVICYSYDFDTIINQSKKDELQYVVLTYEDNGEAPVLKAWSPRGSYTEHE